MTMVMLYDGLIMVLLNDWFNTIHEMNFSNPWIFSVFSEAWTISMLRNCFTDTDDNTGYSAHL